ncbi:MAG: hypothetical protein ACI8UZ_001908 [Akkermansiaceae bacterium]
MVIFGKVPAVKKNLPREIAGTSRDLTNSFNFSKIN